VSRGQGTSIVDPDMIIVDSEDEVVARYKTWYSISDINAVGSSYLQSLENGAYLQLSFKGSALWVRFRLGPDCGKAKVTVDDEERYIDLYSDVHIFAYVNVAVGLSPDVDHTVKIEVTNAKNPSSTNYYVRVDSFAYRTAEQAISQWGVEYIDLINQINTINTINKIVTIENISGVGVVGNISSIGFVETVGNISSIGKIETIENISSIGKIETVENVSSIGIINTIENISSIGRIVTLENVSSIGKVETIENISSIGRLGVVENVSSIGLIETIGNVSAVATIGNISSVERIGVVENISSIGIINTIERAVITLASKGIENGRFETGSLEPWEGPNGEIDTTVVHTGKYSLKIFTGNIEGKVWQDLKEPILLDDVEEIYFYVTSQDTDDKFLKASLIYSDLSTDSTTINVNFTSWQKVSIPFTRGKVLIRVEFTLLTTQATVYIDDVVIQPFLKLDNAGKEIVTISGETVVAEISGQSVVTNISGQAVKVSGETVVAKISGQTVETTIPSTVRHGRVVVPSAVIDLSSGVIRSVVVKANTSNVGIIYMGGDSSISGGVTGLELEAGESIPIDIDNLNKVKLYASNSGDVVTYLGVY